MRQFRDSGYYATTDGNIIGRRGRILKPSKVRGYDKVCIYLGSVKSKKQYAVHRMVAETYIPNPNGKTQVNHINGVKNDNRLSNLEWTTPLENTQHSIRTGLRRADGVNNVNSKLSIKDVEQIRKEYIRNSRTHGTVGLGKKFNTDPKTIWNIIHKKTYTV